MKFPFSIIIFLLTLICFAQETNEYKQKNSFFPKQYKHQIGIGATDFLKVVFNSNEETYTLEYRYAYNKKYSLRVGADYFSVTDDNGSTELGLKLGVDKSLKILKHWEFYYGIDLLTKYEKFESSNIEIYKVGVAPVFGVNYYISPNFSLGIEPIFLMQYNREIDKDTFGDSTTDYYKFGFERVGFIQLNFYF